MSELVDQQVDSTYLSQEIELRTLRHENAELKKSSRSMFWVAAVLFLLFVGSNSGERSVRDDIEDKLSAILDKWDNGAPVSEIKEDLNSLDDELQPQPESDDPY